MGLFELGDVAVSAEEEEEEEPQQPVAAPNTQASSAPTAKSESCASNVEDRPLPRGYQRADEELNAFLDELERSVVVQTPTNAGASEHDRAKDHVVKRD